MAQADAELDSVEVGQAECNGSGAHTQHATCNGSAAPYMPHSALTQEELDRLHPSLVPPDDEQLDDLVSDERDGVYQKGLQLAEEIRNETSLLGRMRRPLLARLTEQQQQHDRSSMQDRTRTIRTSGGGVISGATTSTTTATATTPGTIPTTTDYAAAAVMAVAVVVPMVAATAVEDCAGEDQWQGSLDRCRLRASGWFRAQTTPSSPNKA